MNKESAPKKIYEEYDIELNSYFDDLYDIFGDGSVIGVGLPGHVGGQLGIFLPEYNILFASDASLGPDLTNKEESMRFPAEIAQTNLDQYKQTLANIKLFKITNPDLQIYNNCG